MAKPLVFMMGRAPVFLPVDRLYARNHLWALAQGEEFRFGLSGYAVRLLGELRELEWCVGPGTPVQPRQPIGTVEGSKAVNQVDSPAAGVVLKFNLEVLLDPSLINTNLYDAAWLFDMRCSTEELFTPQEYLAHLETCWKTQSG